MRGIAKFVNDEWFLYIDPLKQGLKPNISPISIKSSVCFYT